MTLDQCCTIVSGATPKTTVDEYWDGDICWTTPKDLSNLEAHYIRDTPRKITKLGLASCGASMLPSGSVLFSSRAPIGHVAINTVPMATNQGFKSFIPKAGILDSKYLFHWLRKNRDFLESLGNGATFKEVSKATVARIEIALPSIEYQCRIAAILDQADALRAKRRESLAQLDGLTHSLFIEMFGNPVSNSKDWPNTTTLGDVANIASGVTKGRNLTNKVTRNVPYLAVANVQDKSLNLSAVKSIEATEDEILRYQLKRDDLLLTEGGDPDKLGRGTLWKNELSDCIHQNHIFRVRLTSEAVTPLFLNWLVGSERGKKFFLRSAKQTTGIASINMTQLRSFPLLLPPIELQRDFEKIALGIAEQRAIHTASMTEIDALFASLQYRAFRGEL